VIVFAESHPGAKVAGPQLVLANHQVDAPFDELGHVEPAAEIAVREHDVAIAKRVMQRAK
jgi:hypothetical protein